MRDETSKLCWGDIVAASFDSAKHAHILKSHSPRIDLRRVSGRSLFRTVAPLETFEKLRQAGVSVVVHAKRETDARVIRERASQINRFTTRVSVRNTDLLDVRSGHKYVNVAEIDSYLENLSLLFPKYAEFISLPHETHECKIIRGLRIGASGGRKAAFVISGMHGVEWGGPDIGLLFVHRILRSLDRPADLVFDRWRMSHAALLEALDDLTIFLVPCLNRDGFNFSQSYVPSGPFDHTGIDWRKNRNPENRGVSDWGTDLNRNYDFMWKFGNSNRGDNNYGGSRAHSEPETLNALTLVSKIVAAETGTLVDVHSFGLQILHPWGHAPIEIVSQSPNLGTRFKTSECAQRGYSEPLEKTLADQIARIAGSMADATARAAGIRRYDVFPGYIPGDCLNLPDCACGTLVDYAFTRPIFAGRANNVSAFTIEFGEQHQAPFAEFIPHAIASCAAIAEAVLR